MLRSDTDCGPMYIRSGRILLSDTHFAILFRSAIDLGLMYIRSARLVLSDTQLIRYIVPFWDRFWCNAHVLLEFCFQTHISL